MKRYGYRLEEVLRLTDAQILALLTSINQNLRASENDAVQNQGSGGKITSMTADAKWAESVKAKYRKKAAK